MADGLSKYSGYWNAEPEHRFKEWAQGRGPMPEIDVEANAPPVGGLVANPGHPVAQALARNWPKIFRALQRRPQTFEFEYLSPEGPLGEVRVPAKGIIPGSPGKTDPAKITESGVPVRIGVQEKMPNLGDAAVTPVHESLHALLATNPNVANLLFPKERAFSVLFGNNRPNLARPAYGVRNPDRLLERPRPEGLSRFSPGAAERAGYEPRQLEYLQDLYSDKGDLGHLSVEAVAQAMIRDRLKKGN